MTFLTRICALFLIAIPAVSVAATMYKWVDAEGHTHYTQEPPPPGVSGEEVKPSPKVSSETSNESLQALEKSLGQTSEQRQKKAGESQKTETDLKEQQRLCEQARARLASYERPRVTVAEADGSRRAASEDERLAELAKSEALIKEFCK